MYVNITDYNSQVISSIITNQQYSRSSFPSNFIDKNRALMKKLQQRDVVGKEIYIFAFHLLYISVEISVIARTCYRRAHALLLQIK